MTTNHNKNTNRQGQSTGYGAKSTLPQNCVRCQKHHYSFECPPALMSKKLKNSPKKPNKDSSSTSGGEKKQRPEMNASSYMRWMDGLPADVNSVRNGRHTRRPRGAATRAPPTPIMSTRPMPLHIPTRPLMPTHQPMQAPLLADYSRSRNRGSNNRPSRNPPNPNPGAYGGSRSMGQEIQRGRLPNEKKMQELIKMVRPFVLGNEDQYEGHAMPVPEAKPVPIPEELPVQMERPEQLQIPNDKIYEFETITRYDLNGNVLSVEEYAREWQLTGGPGDPIIVVVG